MALVITYENKPIFLTAEQGNNLWLVHTGELTGTPDTVAKAAQVEKWYLNRETAPPSYCDAVPSYRQKPKPPQQARLPYVDA